MRYFKIAGINVAIDDKTSAGACLAGSFSSAEMAEEPGRTDFIVRALEDKKDIIIDATCSAVSGKYRANDEAFTVNGSGYSYTVKNLFNSEKTPELLILWGKKRAIKQTVKDILTNKTIGVRGRTARFMEKNMSYSVFWMIFAIVLQRHGRAFVHAGIFSVGASGNDCGKAVVAAGSAGCGKTSTMMGVMERDDARYIDEDFGVIGDDGYAYHIPKTVTVYEEDASFGSHVIRKAIRGLKGVDRFAWGFYKLIGKNQRYKFRSDEIFEGKIADAAPISGMTFLTRTGTGTVKVEEAEDEEIADRITCASYRELKNLYEILNNIRAVGDGKIRSIYPSIRTLEDEHRKIVISALKASSYRYIVEVPFKSAPADVIDAILRGERNVK